MHDQPVEYAGFWIRVGAFVIDTILIILITWPILTAIYGDSYIQNSDHIQGFWDLMFQYIIPAVVIIVFWIYKSATPGKMATKLTIVDAETGGKPSVGQFLIRYLGYFVAALPFFIGIIWVGIDRRKQGWHDKLAGTVVLRNNRPEPVTFTNREV